jgi:protein-S-isoprenylcysteine O-methyltransferase Ste14
MISIILVFQGFKLLRKMGKPDPSRDDSHLTKIEKTTKLVTIGIYGYIRHPLYSSLLFLTWGVFFKNPTPAGVSLAMVSSIFLFVTAKIEEVENLAYFGKVYRKYMEKTKMFIPFII